MTKLPKAVVTFAGARDHYQVPLALQEDNLLDTFVTDIYWPADKKWFSVIKALSNSISHSANWINSRYLEGLGSENVRVSGLGLGAVLGAKLLPGNKWNTFKDRSLSKKSKTIAFQNGASLFLYSYYAYEAFKGHSYDILKYRFLFQVHPHPRVVRQLLADEIEFTPFAKRSLMAEPDLALPEHYFEDLANEPHLANGWVTASTYTASTLTNQGISARKIHIVPYGVDEKKYPQRQSSPSQQSTFTVIFVGSMVQRKGLSYLLDSVRCLKSRQVRVVICGRGFIDRELLDRYSDLPIEIKVSLPRQELVQEIHTSDVMVFPSLVEGFGHVILETMSCGVPIIATDHTCAPDIMSNGTHGFIVPIRDPEAIAEKLEWGITHRRELAAMGVAAAEQARSFTWERFRAGIRMAYRLMVEAVG